MPFQPGRSGNPKGRPKKERVFANLLEQAGTKKVGAKTRSQLLADMIWDALLTGQVVMGTGKTKHTMQLSPKDWRGIVDFYATHTDGPITGPGTEDEPMQHIVRIVTHDSKAK